MSDVQIPNALYNFDVLFLESLKSELPTLGEAIERRWREKVKERAVVKRTGKLEGAIKAGDVRDEGQDMRLSIDTSTDPNVTYSDVFERGRTDAAYDGRFAAQAAIEESEGDIRDMIDRTMQRGFGQKAI